MQTELVIVGTGGHAREALNVAEAMNAASPTWVILGFVDDSPALAGTTVRGYPVLGDTQWLERSVPRAAYALGIGACRVRARLETRFADSGRPAARLVHPRCVVSPDAELGEGVMIAPGAVVSAGVRIGRHSHVNIGASVSHDCMLDDFVHVAPGARLAGNVRVGTGTDVGLGALVIQGTTIGEWAIVGAGAVVLRDVPANVTVVGVPSRIVRTRPAGWELA